MRVIFILPFLLLLLASENEDRFADSIFFYCDRFIPAYFEKDIDSGIPKLTTEGRKALEDELRVTEAGP